MNHRQRMIVEQIESRGVTNPRVLQAMGSISREHFIPEDLADHSYGDHPLPIGYGQTISQPYIVAYMTDQLDLQPTDRVLEIGTGSGYQTAILAKLAREIYSVEIVSELYESAKRKLADLGITNVHFKQGDGWLGWENHAPYDKIIVTAAPPEIPKKLVAQLKEGGILVIPVGETAEGQMLKRGVKKNGVLETVDQIAVRFVPLIKAEEK